MTSARARFHRGAAATLAVSLADVLGFAAGTNLPSGSADRHWAFQPLSEVAIPAFLTIVLMPFTYSITVGIGAGFVSYVFLKLVRGKASEVHALLWVVAGLFVVYFAIDPIKQLLGVS